MGAKGGEVPVSDTVIEVEDVWLSFPLIRFQPRGIKEAFLATVLRQKPPRELREFWALRGVSMKVQKGQVVGVIGRNGSGKSTLLRAISGIYAPDKGRIRTTGRISALELGSGFREELTGAENIRLSGAIMGMSPSEVEDRVDQIIEFAELEEFIDQHLRTYSSGMRTRLGFAVASVIEPEILLMDEVLAVGDAEFKAKSMARIEEMVGGDTTVVIVSHSLDELERLCDRLVLIDRGAVSCEGKPTDVIEAYDEQRHARRPSA
jgi:ABC-type polysaccharide/polyol phosphate transport system ATPase subunit